MPAGRFTALISNLLEGGGEGLAATILARPGPVAREGSSEHAGRDHRGGKAGALLVGPVDHLDGSEGLVAGLHQRAERLKCTKNTKNTIELAAGRLRVEVASHRDRRHIIPLARTPGEHRAHVVDRDGAPQRLAARAKPI